MTVPVWNGDGWQVIAGDWRESAPDSCDHVITDPPYTDHVSTNQRRSVGSGVSQGWRDGGQKIDATPLPFMGVKPADHSVWLAVSNRWVVAFCAFEQLGEYVDVCSGMRKDGGAYIRSGFWNKTNATPQFTGDRPAIAGEAVAIMHRSGCKLRWNGGGGFARWTGPYEMGGRVHETQKPLWLMRQLVADFTDEGDLVWDPYGGSMTTGVACLQLGRRFIGHELRPEMAEIGAKRLESTQRGLTLEDAEAGQGSLFDHIGLG